MSECHYCLSNGKREDRTVFMAYCSVKRCSMVFCLDCIKTNFDPAYDSITYNKRCWVCYFCQRNCNCPKCKNPEKVIKNVPSRSNRKRNSSSVTPINPRLNDESVEYASQQQHSAASTLLSNPLFAKDIEDLKEPSAETGMIPEEDIRGMSPFMRHIANRKNTFYRMVMESHSKIDEELKQKAAINQRLAKQSKEQLHEKVQKESPAKPLAGSSSKNYMKIIQLALERLEDRDDDGFQILA